MNLYDDIQKATMITWNTDNAKFVRLKGESQATKDRKMNERRLRPPRNIQLIEEDDSDVTAQLNTEGFLNEYEIASSIKAVNGGMSYSNELLEHYLCLRQKEAACSAQSVDEAQSLNDSKSSTASANATEACLSKEDINVTNSSNERKETIEDKKEFLKKCGLSKNTAISTLFLQNKISRKNLQMLAVDTAPVSSTEGKSAQSKTGVSDKLNDWSDEMTLVPLPDDPDVFMQPLQAYGKLDENKCKDIDFTVDRVGKKKTITSRQYYTTEVDELSFQFVKRNQK